ncbi:MAG TPA: hypothetical protein VIL32_12480 [Steroidobacteraceae bacterium]
MKSRIFQDLLRGALVADGVLTGISGAAMTLAPALLEAWLGLPSAMLGSVGIALLVYAAFVLWLGTRERIPRAPVIAVIAINALWTLDSLLLLMTGWVEPTVLGYVFTIGQALVVAGLAGLQYAGLKRTAVPAAQPAR